MRSLLLLALVVQSKTVIDLWFHAVKPDSKEKTLRPTRDYIQISFFRRILLGLQIVHITQDILPWVIHSIDNFTLSGIS